MAAKLRETDPEPEQSDEKQKTQTPCLVLLLLLVFLGRPLAGVLGAGGAAVAGVFFLEGGRGMPPLLLCSFVAVCGCSCVSGWVVAGASLPVGVAWPAGCLSARGWSPGGRLVSALLCACFVVLCCRSVHPSSTSDSKRPTSEGGLPRRPAGSARRGVGLSTGTAALPPLPTSRGWVCATRVL